MNNDMVVGLVPDAIAILMHAIVAAVTKDNLVRVLAVAAKADGAVAFIVQALRRVLCLLEEGNVKIDHGKEKRWRERNRESLESYLNFDPPQA